MAKFLAALLLFLTLAFAQADKIRDTSSTTNVDDNKVPPTGMALIPAGSFQMGDANDGIELPVHTVSVSAFYMDKYEVTKALWDEVRAWGGENGYTDLSVGDGKAANHPVQKIIWYDMLKWCNARSAKGSGFGRITTGLWISRRSTV